MFFSASELTFQFFVQANFVNLINSKFQMFCQISKNSNSIV